MANQRDVAIILKLAKVERMIENCEIFHFILDVQYLAKIATLNRDEIIFNHPEPNMVKWLAKYRE